MSTLKQFFNHIDPSYGKHIAEKLTTFRSNPILGFRTAGSFTEHAAGEFLLQEMQQLGLQNITKDAFPLDAWIFKKATLQFHDDKETLHTCHLGAYPMHFITDGLESFELVDMGKGTKQDYANYKGDFKNKFVLIEINQRDEWWINYPAYEAYLQGARGVIAMQSASFAEIDETALNTNNFNGPSDLTALSISQKDGQLLKTLIAHQPNQTLQIKLDVYSEINTTSGTGYNIWGEIPGSTSPEEVILVSAHYDAYYDGFQDNGTAVGLMLGLARTMIQANIQPERTIRFIALSAEEWGAVNSRFDWLIGSYMQIFKVRPEWRQTILYNINFEMPGIESFNTHWMQVPYELQDPLTEWQRTLPFNHMANAYSEGVKFITPNDIWADDFSFSIAGIPSVRNDFTDFPFGRSAYHSQFDSIDTYNEAAFHFNHQLYGALMLHWSQATLVNLSFTTLFKKIRETSIFSQELMNTVIETAEQLEQAIDQEIKLPTLAFDEQSAFNQAIQELFQSIQTSWLTINWMDHISLIHEPFLHTLQKLNESQSLIKQIIQAIDNTQAVSLWINQLIDILGAIDHNSYAINFSEETCKYFTDYVFNQSNDRQFWGQNLVLSPLNVRPFIQKLQEYSAKSFDINQIHELNTMHNDIKDIYFLIEEQFNILLQKQSKLLNQHVLQLNHLISLLNPTSID
ncbi:M28 family peptidase [Atopobacter phocae]|uniref:M28 family peptidase n=1 Tax=Atopobacter phocae TaxID=136492 RepID=UPI000472A38C|nr:M28 family peptidase [Atopobacter phocae]